MLNELMIASNPFEMREGRTFSFSCTHDLVTINFHAARG
jgi:hypothetical protein